MAFCVRFSFLEPLLPSIMVRKTKFIHVWVITSLYSIANMINKFCHDINFSSMGRERDVLMEHCSRDEREDMDTSGDPSSLYFYLHLSVIYDLGVIVPFSSLETRFLTTINVAPPQVTPNVWIILRALQIICCNFNVSPSIRVLLYFYRTKFLPISGWVMLHPFSGVRFLIPFANPYGDWKDKFVRVRGRDNMSHVITWVGGERLSPLSCTADPKFTVRLDSCVLSRLNREVIQVLEYFPRNPTSSLPKTLKIDIECRSI